MRGGKRLAGGNNKKPDMSQFSKWMIADIRPLLWIVTLAALLWPPTASGLDIPALCRGSPPWWASRGPHMELSASFT